MLQPFYASIIQPPDGNYTNAVRLAAIRET